MKILKHSYFKDEALDKANFLNWVNKLQQHNERQYVSIQVQTSLGQTQVYAINRQEKPKTQLVIFPGARTTSLIWDLDRCLDAFDSSIEIYMVETNGLPNLSDGSTPNIKSLEYGQWAAEVLQGLAIKSAFVAGASFGGLIAMKLALWQPSMIRSAFLLNPGCIQSFSLSWDNLYYNILPIVRPTEVNIRKFLDKAIFCKPHHQLSQTAEQLLMDYELMALTRYVDNTQKPYDMANELNDAKVETHLLLGDKDLLFPYTKSLKNAQNRLQNLKSTKVFPNVGHGIETYRPALDYVNAMIMKEIT